MLCLVAQSCMTLCNPWTVACQAPLSMGILLARMGCHVLVQGIFPTQGTNPGLLHCRWIIYHLSYQGSPMPTSYSEMNILVGMMAKIVLINYWAVTTAFCFETSTIWSSVLFWVFISDPIGPIIFKDFISLPIAL